MGTNEYEAVTECRLNSANLNINPTTSLTIDLTTDLTIDLTINLAKHAKTEHFKLSFSKLALRLPGK